MSDSAKPIPARDVSAETKKISIEAPAELYSLFVEAACAAKKFDPKAGSTPEEKEKVAGGVLLGMVANFIKQYYASREGTRFAADIQSKVSDGTIKVSKG